MNLKLQKVVHAITSPTAFSWYGIAGVIATGITTFWATCKWKNMQRDKIFDDEEDEEPTKIEKLKQVGKTALIFACPISTAALTCYCIKHGNDLAMCTIDQLYTANNVLSNRTKDMALGLAAGELRNKMSIAGETPIKTSAGSFSDDPVGEVEDFGKKVLFYDDYCQRWFESTIFDVMKAEIEANKIFALRGFVAVGEYHALLGLDVEEWTYMCGWDATRGIRHGYAWIDYKHYRALTDDGKPYYIIKYEFTPSWLEEFEWTRPI